MLSAHLRQCSSTGQLAHISLHSLTFRILEHPCGWWRHLLQQEWRKNFSVRPLHDAWAYHSIESKLLAVEGNAGGVHDILIATCCSEEIRPSKL